MVTRKRNSAGFTLIEMLVVLAILALLLTIAGPRYLKGIDKAKESTLRSDLRVMREAIDHYYGDHERYPDNLEELVQRGYLRNIPADPITESVDTWQAIPPREATPGAIADIRSRAEGGGENGAPYAEW